MPTRPNKPSSPFDYTGLRLKTSDQYTAPAKNEVQIVDAGGAGRLTAGLLQPAASSGKSYGVFGQRSDVREGRTGAEYGFTLRDEEMTTAGATPKYLMVSVFPRTHNWAGQGSSVLKLELGAYRWGPYTLGPPTKPADALPVDEFQSSAYHLYLSFASFISLLYFSSI